MLEKDILLKDIRKEHSTNVCSDVFCLRQNVLDETLVVLSTWRSHINPAR